RTPNVLDGTVSSLTQVGQEIVVAGTFTQVQNPNTSQVIDRRGVFAFDSATGRVSSAFDLGLDGRVYSVQAAADGSSVYVGGAFLTVAGHSVRNLFKADVSTGELDPDFEAASLNGQVRDLEVVGDRLWVAGKFTHIGGHAQRALGTLDATSGQYDPYFSGDLSGLHNPSRSGSVTDVLHISSNPAGTELVAVGNFTSVDGQDRSQSARFDIGGAAYRTSSWNTSLYTQACSRSFDTYMTDVEYSPDGSYFVVATTGAYGGDGSNSGTSGCDLVARWEDDQSPQATPTWTAYTGGDTTWTVEVTDDVIYTGGHMRWQNNPTAGDRPGEGAVERTGIAALDPVNGLPYSWNPTRTRGVGVQDMLATEDGLYVGSDTTLIGPTDGNRYHARVALLPLSSGTALPEIGSYRLSAQIDTVAVGQSALVRRGFDGHTASAGDGPAGSTNRPDWSTSVGAFMVDGELYVGHEDGALTRQTFDGRSYGPATPVRTADTLVVQSSWHQADVPAMTSLFYSNGRIYFTRTGQSRLYSRSFEVEDDVVGQQRFGVTGPAGLDFASVRGAFVAGGSLFYSDVLGRLFRTGWDGTGTATAPAGTPVQVSGSGVDGENWTSQVMFVEQHSPPPPNQRPTAHLSAACTELTCTLDGTASADEDGSLASYDWDFGDGSPHTGDPTATHTYAAQGERTVTLTVTDDRGATATATRQVGPTVSASPVVFVGSSRSQGNRSRHVVPVPAGTHSGDRMLLFFSANSTRPTYNGPQGWTELESRSGTGILGQVYTRIATAADVATSVAVTSSSYAKDDMTLAVYRGTDTAGPLSASLLQDTAGTEHRTPEIVVPSGGGWLVSFWGEKSSTATSWELPVGQTQRSASVAVTGSGHMLTLLADSGGLVPQGTHGDLVATADAAGRGVTASVLIVAGDDTAPTNRAPEAHVATPSCTALRCTFDGSASSDPDGDDLTYDWDFGDGTGHASTASPEHTYPEAGQRTVTLTVSDPLAAHGTATVTAHPTDSTTAAIEFVAAAASQGNRSQHTVAIPVGVHVGDRLVLLLTANTTTPTYSGPDGWTTLVSANGRGIVLRGWTRVAIASDAGSAATVTSSRYAKSNVTIAAYRSQAATPSVGAVEARVDDGPGAAHVSPLADVSDGRSWLVDYWSDKSGATTSWAAPNASIVRATEFGIGSGRVGSLLADSGGPVPSGSAGGLTATADSTSSRGASASLILHAP
ncbi:MAG: PKD domain-containing protein, partial [Nocardioidaceae bacterium]